MTTPTEHRTQEDTVADEKTPKASSAPTTPQAAATKSPTSYAEQNASPVADGYAQRQKIAEEYGKYVAVFPIYVDGVLAHRPGDAVPTSNVERLKLHEQGLVKTKDAQAASDAVAGSDGSGS